jgi:hypothetical protein
MRSTAITDSSTSVIRLLKPKAEVRGFPKVVVMHGDEAAYNELRAYTLGRGDVAFYHQYVVDTYAVQTATEETRRSASRKR